MSILLLHGEGGVEKWQPCKTISPCMRGWEGGAKPMQETLHEIKKKQSPTVQTSRPPTRSARMLARCSVAQAVATVGHEVVWCLCLWVLGAKPDDMSAIV